MYVYTLEDSYAHATESYSQTTRCSVFRKDFKWDNFKFFLFYYSNDA
jgi:hypothetical protein